jgi:hypothetical protein
MASAAAREKRWIVLSSDGRHTTVGRHTDPTEDEIGRLAEGLKAASLGGWLAITEGVYYSKGKLSVMMVRELAPSPSNMSWESAVAAFQATRDRSKTSAE